MKDSKKKKKKTTNFYCKIIRFINHLGSYACLEVKINLQRDLSAYITDVYIPSSFIVSLSFISFFIDYKSAPARAPLGVTSVLTITTMSDGTYNKLNFRRKKNILNFQQLFLLFFVPLF